MKHITAVYKKTGQTVALEWDIFSGCSIEIRDTNSTQKVFQTKEPELYRTLITAFSKDQGNLTYVDVILEDDSWQLITGIPEEKMPDLLNVITTNPTVELLAENKDSVVVTTHSQKSQQ